MTLKLTVTYPGGDAALPAVVELEADDPDPNVVLPALAMLLEHQRTAAPDGKPLTGEEACRRTLCRHRKGQHGNVSAGGQQVPWGDGYCLLCQSDKCLSFVGAETYGQVDT